MGRDRAAYMREYRARKRAEYVNDAFAVAYLPIQTEHVAELNAKVYELEQEVRHLKAELAKRPRPFTSEEVHSFSTRPFTPVPKKR